MPDVPRDPRQLARDILSGKVRIEDLQRERQLRQGMPASRPMPPPQQPRPVARPVQQPPRLQSPFARQTPAPVRQTVARPVTQPKRLAPAAPRVAAPPKPFTPMVNKAFSEAAPQTIVARASAAPRRGIAGLLRTKQSLRQGIIMAEILGKPVALRD